MARDWAASLLVLVALGCGGADPSPTDPGGPPPAPPPPGGGAPLASGRLELPAATVPGSSGDHEAFSVTHRLPADVAGPAGGRLVIVLRDLTRPAQTCPSSEPEDGCATIDWSDDARKPNVPSNGRFDNRLSLQLEDGARVFYLSVAGSLGTVPALVDPTREHTAIDGNGESWEATLPASVVAGSDLQLRLFLTKWQRPDVEIGYEILVEP